MSPPPVLVEVTRGAGIDARHRGWIAAVSPSGDLLASVGDPATQVFLRSSAKPFQLAPFVASGRFDEYGFSSPTEALAIMAASHSGEDRHVRTVQTLLREGGLSRDVLQCGTHPPFDVETAQRLLRDREPLTPLRHNCSGKHAGMALHAKAAGWEVETYWRPDHPVQGLALEAVATIADIPAKTIVTATDGCGVVTFGLPLRAAALLFARLADPRQVADSSLRTGLERIRDAMMAHPELVGGERRRLDTALMRARPGALVSKGGAEGLSSIGILARKAAGRSPGAIGLAVKVEDGDAARRAGSVAVCAALEWLGVLDGGVLRGLQEFAAPSVLDPRGLPSGALKPVFALR